MGVYTRSLTHLNKEQSYVLKPLLWSKWDLFSRDQYDSGFMNKPIQSELRLRLDQQHQSNSTPIAFLCHNGTQTITEMHDQEVIKPSTCLWCLLIVLVHQKDGSTWFCVDFQKLSTINCKDTYPLPRVNSRLDSLLPGSSWFSILGLKILY